LEFLSTPVLLTLTMSTISSKPPSEFSESAILIEHELDSTSSAVALIPREGTNAVLAASKGEFVRILAALQALGYAASPDCGERICIRCFFLSDSSRYLF
jgi:hypothetical protein